MVRLARKNWLCVFPGHDCPNARPLASRNIWNWTALVTRIRRRQVKVLAQFFFIFQDTLNKQDSSACVVRDKTKIRWQKKGQVKFLLWIAERVEYSWRKIFRKVFKRASTLPSGICRLQGNITGTHYHLKSSRLPHLICLQTAFLTFLFPKDQVIPLRVRLQDK